MTQTSKLNTDEIRSLRAFMEGVGLRLATASGLEGGITNSTAVINSLLDMADKLIDVQHKLDITLQQAHNEIDRSLDYKSLGKYCRQDLGRAKRLIELAQKDLK